MSNPTLQDVAQRFREGDEQALADLLDRCQDRLLRIARFRLHPTLRGRIDPEDVLQEAFLAASSRKEHCRAESPESVFIWLRLILLQTMVDLYRRHIGAQARNAVREVHIATGGVDTTDSISLCLYGSITSPSGAAIREERTNRLEETLRGMNEIDREVLALRHFEELSNSEVAEALEIEPKAASIRYVRALRRLRELVPQSDASKHPG